MRTQNPLFTDDMNVYTENQMVYIDKLLELISLLRPMLQNQLLIID